MNNEHPLAEVFGFTTENMGESAIRYRKLRLCPFNNKVPNCTKDKAKNPLGVCSVWHGEKAIITCPTRFREDWVILENAAKFAFGTQARWTAIPEVRIKDAQEQSAGNIDFVLIHYNKAGKVLDFASLEVQGVYISGNLRNPFEDYIKQPNKNFTWKKNYNYPKPDYLSSSRKRLIPQILYKGSIFNAWQKKQCVALQKSFFDTLPKLDSISPEEADIAWFLYDLLPCREGGSLKLTLVDIAYTSFLSTIQRVTIPEIGEISEFSAILQQRLDKQIQEGTDFFHSK